MKNKTYSKMKAFGMLAVFALMVINLYTSADAAAVRPYAITRNAAGIIPGGSIEVPMGGIVFRHSAARDMSADGNFVVFASTASASTYDPAAADGVGTILVNVFLRDVRTGETICLSCDVANGVYQSWGGIDPRITPDGRYVVYAGPDMNVPGSFTINQIYRYDRMTGTRVKVSVSPTGQNGNLFSMAPLISDDGRYVAFTSTANNLVAGFTGPQSMHVYHRDMDTGQTVLASHAAGSTTQGGNAQVDMTSPITMSANGRFVVWTSSASNLSQFVSDSNGVNDVFYFDRSSSGDNVGVVSVVPLGVSTGNGASRGARIAADSGNFPPRVVFISTATNLNPADTNNSPDVYMSSTSPITLVSVARDGGMASGVSGNIATISRNGRFITFTNNAANLVNGVEEPNNNTPDVFLRDMQTGTTEYISLNANGTASTTADGAAIQVNAAMDFTGANPQLNKNVSDDGRFVAFGTAEVMNARDSAGTYDIFVRDRLAGMNVMVSTNSTLNGGQNTGGPNLGEVFLSSTGRKVAFSTKSTNLATSGDQSSPANLKAYQADILLTAQRSLSDFDGDLVNDLTIYRPSEGAWYTLLNPGSGEFSLTYFGDTDTRLVPGDYDGDGKIDHAVFYPASGRWEILQSKTGDLVTRFFGSSTDIVRPADYDGDGKTDIAYFRPSTANWSIVLSSTGLIRSLRFGLSSDIPVNGDFDGDNRADVAIYRPSAGTWWIRRSLDESVMVVQWGISTDKPVTGDYDGDGKTDIAVYRDGAWYIYGSSDGMIIRSWGLSGDRPVPSDYDGDGMTDIGVYRPSTGGWYVVKGDGSWLVTNWGTTGDQPVPAAYIP